MDANIVIDFFDVKPEFLGLTVNYFAPIYVIKNVLEETKNIDINKLLSFGVIILETKIPDSFNDYKKTLSMTDRLCLLTAKQYDRVCATNDKALRKSCEREGVPVIRCLKLVFELCNAEVIKKDEAVAFARALNKTNPYFTDDIIKTFFDSIFNIDIK
jgi:rRNA-processing protein FCF1